MKKLLIGLSALVVLLLSGCATPSPTSGVTGSNSETRLKKACDLNNGVACKRLGVLYRDGKGVKKDYSKAMNYFKKGCDLNHALACAYVSGLYQDGKGVKKDYSKAMKYMKKCCDLKDSTCCLVLLFRAQNAAVK